MIRVPDPEMARFILVNNKTATLSASTSNPALSAHRWRGKARGVVISYHQPSNGCGDYQLQILPRSQSCHWFYAGCSFRFYRPRLFASSKYWNLKCHNQGIFLSRECLVWWIWIADNQSCILFVEFVIDIATNRDVIFFADDSPDNAQFLIISQIKCSTSDNV